MMRPKVPWPSDPGRVVRATAAIVLLALAGPAASDEGADACHERITGEFRDVLTEATATGDFSLLREAFGLSRKELLGLPCDAACWSRC